MIFDALLGFFMNLILSIFNIVTERIVDPIIAALTGYFGTTLAFSDILNYISLFINSVLFRGAQFFKMSIINLTGISNNILMLFVVLVIFKLSIYFIVLVSKFALNLWRTFRGSKTGNK